MWPRASDYRNGFTPSRRHSIRRRILWPSLVVGALLTGLLIVNWPQITAPGIEKGITHPNDLHRIEGALEAFKIQTGRYPSTSEGLAALMKPPPGTKGWDGPYIKSLPNDPWGHPYVYRRDAKVLGRPYVLLSVGPDGIEGTDDDDDPYHEQ